MTDDYAVLTATIAWSDEGRPSAECFFRANPSGDEAELQCRRRAHNCCAFGLGCAYHGPAAH
eukprot:1970568-Pleurochrysis_carterae.AAC.1